MIAVGALGQRRKALLHATMAGQKRWRAVFSVNINDWSAKDGGKFGSVYLWFWACGNFGMLIGQLLEEELLCLVPKLDF